MESERKPTFSRRKLLKSGLAISALAVTGFSVWQLFQQEDLTQIPQDIVLQFDQLNFLNSDDALLLWILTPVYLHDGTEFQLNDETRFKVIKNLDQAIGFLSKSTQQELRDLFDTLTFELGRAFLAGVLTSWTEAKSQAIAQFLENWRYSFINLFRASYLGLHKLIIGAFYALPESWKAIDYRAPQTFNFPESYYQQFD